MYEMSSVFVPTTREGMPTNGSDCILSGRDIREYTADSGSKTKVKNHYNFIRGFETKSEIQYFGR